MSTWAQRWTGGSQHERRVMWDVRQRGWDCFLFGESAGADREVARATELGIPVWKELADACDR